MLVTDAERRLCQVLQDLPQQHRYRYTADASRTLQNTLFVFLTAESRPYLQALFRGKSPSPLEKWSLREAQGMTEDMEYTEAARGKPCGHIFKNGDSVYRCKTCTNDDTCVLCTRCFEASDHTGHITSHSISPGNTGCCDCGDDEAWKLIVKCGLHTAYESDNNGKQAESQRLPDDLLECIHMTIGRAMDYLIDVLSCSPENLRIEKNEHGIKSDERHARLDSVWYRDTEELSPEYALILWNDEKHTIPEVERQVSRACKKARRYGQQKAEEINDTGRSVIEYSKDIQKLLKIAEIVEQIKLTVTIRSSRDYFREQMCATIIEWLGDIASCSVGTDHGVLRNSICEEILKVWRMGSEASNKWVGKDGLDDHTFDEAAEGTSFVMTPAGRTLLAGRMRVVQVDNTDSDEISNDNDNDNEDEDEEMFVERDTSVNEEDTATDIPAATPREFDVNPSTELEDETEVSEATYAGYPPPPPPPPAPNAELDGGVLAPGTADIRIPETEYRPRKRAQSRPPAYWLDRPDKLRSRGPVHLYEDLQQRVRLDWLLLYDLRLWKSIRTNLRDLYISTVVCVPQFKRILGLRFAGLYGVLAQLYLVADREPDHSIVLLSVQLFTTPSITKEVVENGNFLTALFSILYTFLTKRTVQHPWQVGADDALNFEHGAVANRRMYHFFIDLKHVLGIEYVQNELRSQERYLLQFLDLVRLPQGICPNVRAVGEHVEYESDTWIAAQVLTKEINRTCRQFAEIFDESHGGELTDLYRAIRTVAKATIINSLGAERMRFDQAEIKNETCFETLPQFSFEPSNVSHSVVDFVVEREPISFHHALHYTLSWLIDAGKGLSNEEIRRLLSFTPEELVVAPPVRNIKIPRYQAEDYLMAMFDFPLRVCAWLAQMRAGMWVRNGISLRHQMTTYRGVSHRDLAHQRDIFLLQTALVICDSSRILASMIERFGMRDWMRGNFVIRPGFELGQQFDVAEDFIHLLIILLSDRTTLQLPEDDTNAHIMAIRRDIIHILCFKPLSFSELNNRFADKTADLEEFQELLDEMTNYRPPEGLQDTGSFELKREYLADVDPYAAHYTKNQRDEAENAYRKWIAEKSGRSEADVVYEPSIQPLGSALFAGLANFTRTSLFTHIIFFALACTQHPAINENIPHTRIESYLQVVLHLTLLAVLEDDKGSRSKSPSSSISPFVATSSHESGMSFIGQVLRSRSDLDHTILDLLIKILGMDDMKSCHPKIRLILHRIRQSRPIDYEMAINLVYHDKKLAPLLPVESLGYEAPRTPMDDDQEDKQRQARELRKQQALDRQARVMAQMQQQQQNFLDNQPMDEMADDDSSDVALPTDITLEEHTQTWRYPAGNCILCQEEADESQIFGTFALMSMNNFFRKTDVQDPDFLEEVLTTPASLDRSADGIRPFGLAGKNKYQVKKRTSDGGETTKELQGISKGFPPASSKRAPLSTGCGHIMHFKCFSEFCMSTKRRQEHQIARNHPEVLGLKEFVCPLCKALGNTFLPIIWKGKEESYPGKLETETSFESWCSSGIGLTLSRFYKSQGGRAADNRLQEIFATYITQNVIPPVAAGMLDRNQDSLSSPTSPLWASNRTSLQNLPSILYAGAELSGIVSRQQSAIAHPDDELTAIHCRLRDTIGANSLYDVDIDQSDTLNSSDDAFCGQNLVRTLGHSITAAEIAQRGIQSEPGQTLLDKIPSSLLTHLRILSESVSSYMAIGIIRTPGAGAFNLAFSATVDRQLKTLFGGHPQVATNPTSPEECGDIPAAIAQDAFILLTDCSVYLLPAVNFDIHHVLRICYMLHVVKTALYLTTTPETLDICQKRLSQTDQESVPVSNLQALHHFVLRLSSFSNPPWPVLESHPIFQRTFAHLDDISIQKSYGLLYRGISTYALSFLRKAAILLNVRYGVDYPDTGFADMEESELNRLSRLLHLPSLPELLASGLEGSPDDGTKSDLAYIVEGWIQHWQMRDTVIWHRANQQHLNPQRAQVSLKQIILSSLQLGHPVIFELIGLPEYFDTLTYEVTRHRCPTKGHKLEDPALCLFCGAIFCSQALCCSKDGKGGANQHMQR